MSFLPDKKTLTTELNDGELQQKLYTFFLYSCAVNTILFLLTNHHFLTMLGMLLYLLPTTILGFILLQKKPGGITATKLTGIAALVGVMGLLVWLFTPDYVDPVAYKIITGLMYLSFAPILLPLLPREEGNNSGKKLYDKKYGKYVSCIAAIFLLIAYFVPHVSWLPFLAVFGCVWWMKKTSTEVPILET